MAISELSIQQAEPTNSCVMEAVSTVTAYPTIMSYVDALWRHDPNSAEHDIRVMLGVVHAAKKLGLNTEFAALCGVSHDLGKLGVDAETLRQTTMSADTIAAIRRPHMETLRMLIHAIPREEIAESEKMGLLAVIMAHHEIVANTNGRSAYPRETVVGNPAFITRRTSTSEIRAFQSVLALADIADRVIHGFHNTVHITLQEAQRMMHHIVEEAAEPLLSIEKELYVPLITDSIFSITEQQLQESLQALGINAHLEQ